MRRMGVAVIFLAGMVLGVVLTTMMSRSQGLQARPIFVVRQAEDEPSPVQQEPLQATKGDAAALVNDVQSRLEPIPPASTPLVETAPAQIAVSDASVDQDPEREADDFVNKTREEIQTRVQKLQDEAKSLRERLNKVEKAAGRMGSLLSAIDEKEKEVAETPVDGPSSGIAPEPGLTAIPEPAGVQPTSSKVEAPKG